MKKLRNILAALAVAIPLGMGTGGCHHIDEWDNDLYGNFDALWTIIDEHYCFFSHKEWVDWENIRLQYRSQIKEGMTYKVLFALCADMLEELRDGHTNLISWFDVSYYRQWWSDYPQNYEERLVQQYYLTFDHHTGGGIEYKLLEDSNVGYMRYASFAATPGHSFIDNMMLELKDCDGLIIDVRNNSGGEITNVERIASHFIRDKFTAGYITHKTGPGHDDFSEPYPITYAPADQHVRWFKPVIVLTNRSTFSAANTFVSVMKALPQVAVAGDVTGGGCGMPFSSELPSGWAVRFSASPVYDSEMQLTEFGIAPTAGAEVALDPVAALSGTDTMIDFAVEAIKACKEQKVLPKQYFETHGKE